MPVRRDARTGQWFFRTIIHFPDGKRRVFGTPGIPGPYHDLSSSKAGAEEAERRAIKAALAPRTSVAKTSKKTPAKKLWVVYTLDLKYNVTALGETEEQAKRAIWERLKHTNNSGYGMTPEMTSLENFFEDSAWRSYQLAPGEATSE